MAAKLPLPRLFPLFPLLLLLLLGSAAPGRSAECADPDSHCSCDSSGDCSGACSSGWTGAACAEACPQHCYSRCDRETAACSSCERGFYGTNCSTACPQNCYGTTPTCAQEDGECSSCNPGWWDPHCESPCRPNGTHYYSSSCPMVSGPTGRSCQGGFWGDNCTLACPANCYGTTSPCGRADGVCSSCKTGFWGDECDQPCQPPGTHYSSTGCPQSTGPANRSCENGYWGPTCTSACPTTCYSSYCANSDGSCSSCKTGLWGEFCEFDCALPGSHFSQSSCPQASGPFGRSCSDGWHGQNCSLSCPGVCSDRCSSDGSCYTCPTGTYGPLCEHSCKNATAHCDDGACDIDDGACSCDGPWWGDRCTLPCIFPERCSRNDTCNSEGKCSSYTRCADGWWGDDNCQFECFANNSATRCATNTCDRDTGVCEECAPGYYGSECDQRCLLSTCRDDGSCDRESGKCSASAQCAAGRWGDDCEKECASTCDDTGCSRATGRCYQCPSGFFDTLCDQPCGHCRGSSECDREDARCYSSSGCEPGWTTFQCNTPCSTAHCDFNNSCQITDGSRCDRCENGWVGNNCSLPCLGLHCAFFTTGGPDEQPCNEETRLCDYGCSSGWAGEYCDTPCSGHCLNNECHASNASCTHTRCDYGWHPFPACNTQTCSDTGEHRSRDDPAVCEKCAPGTASAAPAGSSTFDPQTSLSCPPCAKGTYGNATGLQRCSDCEVGTYQALTGQTGCTPCPARLPYGTKEGATSASDGCSAGYQCDPGEYNPGSGTSPSDCMPCPAGRFSDARGAEGGCPLCPEGRYQPSTGQSRCETCLTGTFSDPKGSGCLRCEAGQFANFSEAAGETECAWCPAGRYSSNESLVCGIRCSACLPQNQCVQGHHGLGCALCDDDYYIEDGRCHACDSVPWSLLVAVAAILAAFALLFRWGMDLGLTVRLKIMTSFFQLISLSASVAVLWPGSVDWTRATLDVMTGGFQGFHSECYSSLDHAQKVYLSVFLPFALVGFGVLLDRAVAWKRRQLRDEMHGLGLDTSADRRLHQASLSIRRVIVLFVTLVYTPVLQLLLSVHQCTDGAPPRLEADPRVVCEGSSYDSLKRFAAAFGVIIGAGLPFGIVAVVATISRSDKGLHHGDNLDSVGALYEPYKDSVAWFESAALLRKAAMLLILSYVDSGVAQALINLCVSLGWLGAIYRVRPFVAEFVDVGSGRQVDLNNTLEGLSSVVTVFNHVLAFFVGVSDNPDASAFFGVLFLVANLGGLLAFNFKLFLKSRKKAADAEDEEKMYAALNDSAGGVLGGTGGGATGGGTGGTAEGEGATLLVHDPTSARLATSLGDHIKEGLLELAMRRANLASALQRRDIRAADGLWSRMKNVEGRLLSEMERSLVVAHQQLNVEHARLISAWLEARNQRIYRVEQLVARVDGARASVRDQFAASEMPHFAALQSRNYFPQLARADESCFAEAAEARALLDALYADGLEERSFEACRLAASGLDFLDTSLKKLVGVRGADGVSDRQRHAADQAANKWREYVAKHMGRTGARVTEAARAARFAVERGPPDDLDREDDEAAAAATAGAGDGDAAAAAAAAAAAKAREKAESKLRGVYKRLAKDEAALWAKFDKSVVPALVAAARHRLLQELHDDMVRQSQERARMYDPQRRQAPAPDVEPGEGEGEGEGAGAPPASLLLVPDAVRPAITLEALSAEMSGRHADAKSQIARGEFERGQRAIGEIRSLLARHRRGARRGEWLCMLYSTFSQLGPQQELRLTCTRLIAQLGKKQT